MNCTKRRRVLLVDQEPMVLSAIESFLALETEHEVVSFCSPYEALDYLVHHRVDVVVADLTLTNMDGCTFFEEVKRIDGEIRIVMLSGCGEDNWADDMRKRGLYGCLDKPWCNDELSALIQGGEDSE